MRIRELHVKNWEVIRQADFTDLSDFVVIAGPNGVGKTKVKQFIVHIFENGGNPPSGSSVVLEATSQEEIDAWGSELITLPRQSFWSYIAKNTKRVETKSRLIQIDSNRIVESINFQQMTFQAIGDPEQEEVGYGYGFNDVKSRFNDICNTLHRLKSKQVTSVFEEYQEKLAQTSDSQININKLPDPTDKYIDAFNKLLYPKRMLPIDVRSSTIQYYDDDSNVRQFSELSSGEREVVILTFDILTQNPSDCLILIDEPEVHLHPELTFRLIKTLKSIGESNQYFLFTHSADIIGSSLDTGVHFIRPKGRQQGDQVVRIDQTNVDAFKSIPNLRETIGMISVGKKLLFVEGGNTSIDRNVFATLAKATKTDVAIIPSDSCTNINNMALMCQTLEKGLFGLNLYMVRDRDSLTEQQVDNFITKSSGRLMFLPFYHIENAFLDPKALSVIATALLFSRAPSVHEIEDKLLFLARQQLKSTTLLYVKQEINFSAGNLDLSPASAVNESHSIQEIAARLNSRKSDLLNEYNNKFTEQFFASRLGFWQSTLEKSLIGGWSADARKYFYGKRILNEIQGWLFPGKRIAIWEHIANSTHIDCIDACRDLHSILSNV